MRLLVNNLEPKGIGCRIAIKAVVVAAQGCICKEKQMRLLVNNLEPKGVGCRIGIKAAAVAA